MMVLPVQRQFSERSFTGFAIRANRQLPIHQRLLNRCRYERGCFPLLNQLLRQIPSFDDQLTDLLDDGHWFRDTGVDRQVGIGRVLVI